MVTIKSLSRLFKPKEKITPEEIIKKFGLEGKVTSVKVIGDRQKSDFEFGEGIILSKPRTKSHG